MLLFGLHRTVRGNRSTIDRREGKGKNFEDDSIVDLTAESTEEAKVPVVNLTAER